MNDLINVFEKRGKIFTNSRTIAQETEKRHSHVLRSIDGIIERMKTDSTQIWAECFTESVYSDESGKSNKEYLLTKRGFLLYIFSIEGYEKFKMTYIDRFEQMESLLRERQTSDWLQTREKGKLIRREETDAIQRLIPYAEAQGSKNAKMFYMNYSKMVNNAVGIEPGTRDRAPYKTLMLIALMEDIINHTIEEEMSKNVYYKDIYRICKGKMESFVKLTYLETA